MITPAFKNIAHIKKSGELQVIFGSLHHFHVIHTASRNYTWKAGILCVIDGIGHYIEKFWGICFTISLHKIYVMRSWPSDKYIVRELFMQ